MKSSSSVSSSVLLSSSSQTWATFGSRVWKFPFWSETPLSAILKQMRLFTAIIRLERLGWVPHVHCAWGRGLKLLTAVSPVEVAHSWVRKSFRQLWDNPRWVPVTLTIYFTCTFLYTEWLNGSHGRKKPQTNRGTCIFKKGLDVGDIGVTGSPGIIVV